MKTIQKLILFMLIGLFMQGCTTTQMRRDAMALVRDLEKESINRDMMYEAELKKVVVQMLEAKRQTALAKFDQEKSQLAQDVYLQFETKQEELFEYIDTRLQEVMEPVFDNMLERHGQEVSKKESGAPREGEIRAALELSSAMAETQRQKMKLYKETMAQIKSERAKIIEELSKASLPSDFPKTITERKVKKMFNDAGIKGAEFQAWVSESADVLEEYIFVDSIGSISSNFIKGVLGDKLGTKFSSTIDALTQQFDEKVEGEISKLTDVTMAKIGKTKLPMEGSLK